MYSKMMLAQALRNPQAPMGGGAMGGTQMPAQTGIPAMQSYGAPEFTGMNEGMNKDLGAAAGKAGQWMKDNYFAGPQADGMAQASAATTIGPEVAKMGGSMAPANDQSKNGGFSGMFGDALKAVSPVAMGIDSMKDGKWKDVASMVSPAMMGWNAIKGLF